MSSEPLNWITDEHYQLDLRYLFADVLTHFKEDCVAFLGGKKKDKKFIFYI